MNVGQQTDFFKMLLILITVNVMIIFMQSMYNQHLMLSEMGDINEGLPGQDTYSWLDKQLNTFRKDNQDKTSWWSNNIVGSFMVGTWDILVNIGMFILLFFAIFFGFLGHAIAGTFTGEATVFVYIGTLIYLGVVLINVMYIRRMYNLLTGK